MAKVAFVTGASSGLGRGLALRLAAEGWAVGVAARRAPELDDLVSRIEDRGGRAARHICDVASREQVGQAVAECVEALGPVDLLVANAGFAGRTYPETLDADEVARIHQVNFMGVVHAVEAVLPAMLEAARGHIVGVGSLAGLRALPTAAAYSASKAALASFLESLRVDLRPMGVRVTVLLPGFVRTAMTARGAYRRPFLLEEEEAVDRMYRAIVRGKRLHAFPAPLATVARASHLIPAGVYDAILGRLAASRRRSGGQPPPAPGDR